MTVNAKMLTNIKCYVKLQQHSALNICISLQRNFILIKTEYSMLFIWFKNENKKMFFPTWKAKISQN